MGTRDVDHPYGFAAFTVDPGRFPGDTARMHATYYSVDKPNGELSVLSSSPCAASGPTATVTDPRRGRPSCPSPGRPRRARRPSGGADMCRSSPRAPAHTATGLRLSREPFRGPRPPIASPGGESPRATTPLTSCSPGSGCPRTPMWSLDGADMAPARPAACAEPAPETRVRPPAGAERGWQWPRPRRQRRRRRNAG